jgi:acyl carrier protein
MVKERDMDPQEIESKVKQIISAQLEVAPDKLSDAASFVDDLKADSLAVVELVLALEEAFHIEIPDEDTEQIKTVKDAVDYVKTHIKK